MSFLLNTILAITALVNYILMDASSLTLKDVMNSYDVIFTYDVTDPIT